MSARLAACAFDLDGTIVESRRGIELAVLGAIEDVMPGLQPGDIGPAIGARVPQLFRRCLPTATSSELLLLEQAFRSRYDAEGWRASELHEDVKESLRGIRALGASLHLVTNKPDVPTRNMLDLHGIADEFSTITCPNTPPGHASKADALRSVVTRLGTPAEAVLYVGDTEEDRDAARQAGTWFIGMAHGYGASELERSGSPVVAGFPELLQAVTSGQYMIG